jgi:hypothetical protein
MSSILNTTKLGQPTNRSNSVVVAPGHHLVAVNQAYLELSHCHDLLFRITRVLEEIAILETDNLCFIFISKKPGI